MLLFSARCHLVADLLQYGTMDSVSCSTVVGKAQAPSLWHGTLYVKVKNQIFAYVVIEHTKNRMSFPLTEIACVAAFSGTANHHQSTLYGHPNVTFRNSSEFSS